MQSDYLKHHGILGQKWGVRRFQNEDGSLTPAGKKRLYSELKSSYKKNNAITIDKRERVADNVIRKHLTDEQKKSLSTKFNSWQKAEKKEVDEFNKEFEKERNRQFKNKKLDWVDEEYLYDYIHDKMSGSKTSEDTFNKYNEFMNYSKQVTNELIGKYGDKKVNSNYPEKYSVVVNRVLYDVAAEPYINVKSTKEE